MARKEWVGRKERIGNHFYEVSRDETRPPSAPDPAAADKEAFIAKHRKEIEPLLKPGVNDPDAILETFETKILTWSPAQPRPQGQKILLEAAQPANYEIVQKLMGELKKDSRCASITLVTDNVTGQRFAESPDMQQVRATSGPVLADIPEGPYAAALIFDEPDNSPAPFLRESAQSVFGAHATYYYSPGVPDKKSIERAFPEEGTGVDMLLTADDFTARFAHAVFGVAKERIMPIGSPQIDAIQELDVSELRRKGRESLGIPHDAKTALYLGFPSVDYQNIIVNGEKLEVSPTLNADTYAHVLEGAVNAARTNPSEQFSLIVRTHPRARQVEPLSLTALDIPQNLQVISGDGMSYDEAVYASDLLCCIATSTEALFGYYRGRPVAFCTFSDAKGGTKEVTEALYKPEGVKVMEETGRGSLLSLPADLSEIFTVVRPFDPPPRDNTHTIERLKDLLMGGLPVAQKA